MTASSYGPNPPIVKTATGSRKKKAVETGKSKKYKRVHTDYEAESSSNVPKFDITIQRSYLMFLAVPKKFVDSHMPKKTTLFNIHVERETWEVLYLVTHAQSRFSAGWSGLVKDLGLEVGDVCKFKLIKPDEFLLKVSRE